MRAERLARARQPIRTRRRSSAAPTATDAGDQRDVPHRPPARPRRAGDPVVIDWRAPIARALLPRHARRPDGRAPAPPVRLPRRQPVLVSRTSTSTAASRSGLASDLLREEIERPRVGPMRDIVATIQPDQDDLVRADLDTSLCIQGAPGTGKTAVGPAPRRVPALHLSRSGCAAPACSSSGRTAAFLHYIAQVLPSLGEGGIEQATVDELVGAAARGRRAGGRRRRSRATRGWPTCCARAVLSHVAKPTEDVVAIVGTRRYRVGAHHLRRYVDDARRALGDGPALVARARAAAHAGRRGRPAPARGRRRRAVRRRDGAASARSQAVRDFVDEVWPALTPRRRCCRGSTTTPTSCAALRAPR